MSRSPYYLGILMDVARALQGVEPGQPVATDPEYLPEKVRRLREDLIVARKKLELRERRSAVDTHYSPDFETFWAAWPDSRPPFTNNTRKRGKGAAFRRWETKRKQGVLPPLTVVMRALESAYCSKAWHEDDGQYIPMPETWVSQHGWDDVYEPASSGRYREGGG